MVEGVDSLTARAGGRSVTISGADLDRLVGRTQRARGAGDGTRDDADQPRRTVTGAPPNDFCNAPTERAFINRAWLAAGGDPNSEHAPHDAWYDGDDIGRIANLLIDKHRRFRHLGKRMIAYRWKYQGGATNGKDTLGKCVKLSGVTKIYTGDVFLIWVAADHATWHKLTNYQLEALIFHELCHATETDKGQPSLAPHDATVFIAEVEEYGLWMADLVRLGQATTAAAEQARLWADDDEDRESE